MKQQAKLPEHLRQTFGPEVKITSENIAPDQWTQNMLRECGKTLKHGENGYLGSFAVHVYSPPKNVLQVASELIFITQIVGNKQGEGLSHEVNEGVAVFAESNLALIVRQHYNPSFKNPTRDPADKRD